MRHINFLQGGCDSPSKHVSKQETVADIYTSRNNQDCVVVVLIHSCYACFFFSFSLSPRAHVRKMSPLSTPLFFFLLSVPFWCDHNRSFFSSFSRVCLQLLINSLHVLCLLHKKLTYYRHIYSRGEESQSTFLHSPLFPAFKKHTDFFSFRVVHRREAIRNNS